VIADIRFLNVIDPIVNVMKIMAANPLHTPDILDAIKVLVQSQSKNNKHKIENPCQPNKSTKARKATQKKNNLVFFTL
jgi:hypothetical protein